MPKYPHRLSVSYQEEGASPRMAMDIAEVIGDMYYDEDFDEDEGTITLIWQFPSREIRNVAYDMVDGAFGEAVGLEKLNLTDDEIY